jgi:hypothetical protein
MRRIVSVRSPEYLRQSTSRTSPAIVLEMVNTTMTTNLLKDAGGLSSKEAKKLAPIDMKKIARFKHAEDGPPRSRRRNSSSETR